MHQNAFGGWAVTRWGAYKLQYSPDSWIKGGGEGKGEREGGEMGRTPNVWSALTPLIGRTFQADKGIIIMWNFYHHLLIIRSIALLCSLQVDTVTYRWNLSRCSCRLLVHKSRRNRKCRQRGRSYEICCAAAKGIRITSMTSRVNRHSSVTRTSRRCMIEHTNILSCALVWRAYDNFQDEWPVRMYIAWSTTRFRRKQVASHLVACGQDDVMYSFDSCGLQLNNPTTTCVAPC